MKKHILKQRKLITSMLLALLLVSGYFTFFDRDINMASASWWNDSWAYRKAITINSDQVVSDLTDFPMLVSFTDSSLGEHAQEDGDDIIFIDSEGKKLSHEIEKFASSTGELVAWVKIPSLSSSENQDFYMYYGNARVGSQEDVTGVWDDDYKMVQHLEEEGTGTRYDSTSYNNDATTYSYEGNEATTTSKIGGGEWYDDVGYLRVNDPDELNSLNSLTFSMWVNLDANDKQWQTGISRMNASSTYEAWRLDPRRSWVGPEIVADFDDSADNEFGEFAYSTTALATSTWYYLVGTFDGSDLKLYINDTLIDTRSQVSGPPSSDGDLWIGTSADWPSSNYIEGYFDEVRISTVSRSLAWIQTEYNNQNNPSVFISDETEEVGPGSIAYWSFDEGYGSTTHDESGQGKHGTISGATWTEGEKCKAGKCLYFDGVDDYVDMGTSSLFDLENNFSLCSWVNWLSLSNNEAIFSKSGAYKLDLDTSNNLRHSALTEQDYAYDFSVQTNKWYHICTAMDSSNDVAFYINGVYKDTVTGSNPNKTSSSSLLMGYYSDYFHGYLDEVKIYPYAIGAEVAARDYNAGIAGQGSPSSVAFGAKSLSSIDDGLVGYWNFDDANYDDDFEDGGVDYDSGDMWSYLGSGGTTTEENGVLKLSRSFSTWHPYGLSGNGNFVLSGDFDIRVDFGSYNPSGISDGGAAIYLNDGTGYEAYVRRQGTGNRYDTDSGFAAAWGNYKYEDSASFEATGTIRIIREGSNISTYRDDGGDWNLIDSSTSWTSNDCYVEIFITAPDGSISVNLDNFIISNQELALDSSGDQNNGTYFHEATTEEGRFGRGLYTGGTASSSVFVPTTSKLEDDIDYDFSVAGWFKSSADGGYIMSTYEGSGWGYYIVSLNPTVGNLQVWLAESGNEWFFSNKRGLVDGKWHHFVLVRDTSKKEKRLYIDGEIDTIETASNNELITFQNHNLYIANDRNEGTSFNGNIDEVRIYNRALAASEVMELYEWAPGPILYLDMDEMSGTRANDSSGNNFYADFVAAPRDPSWTIGKYGAGLEFFGTDTRLVTNAIPIPKEPDSGLTTMLWVYNKDLSSSDNILEIGGSDNLTFSNSGAGDWGCRMRKRDLSYVVGATAAKENVWQHLACVYDPVDQLLKQYMDGLLVNTVDASSFDNFPYPDVLNIGSREYNTSGLEGYIDEVKMYDYARTHKQILKDMHAGSPMKGAVLDLGFDEGRGATAYDSSIYKNNGSLQPGTGGSNTASSAMWTSDGVLGGAVKFDGVDDFLEVATSDSLEDIDYDFSVSLWFKTDGDMGTLISSYEDYGSGFFSLAMAGGPNQGKVWMEINDGAGALVYTEKNNYDDGEWHHAVIVRDTSKLLSTLYVDGAIGATSTATSTEFLTYQNARPILGSSQGIGSFIDGSIDELKIFPYAINIVEVNKLFNLGSAVILGDDSTRTNISTSTSGRSKKYCIPGDTAQCDAPVLEYKLDEMEGSTAYDTSGNANDGSINGAAWGLGKLGSALVFDGDDYITSTDLDISGDGLTIEAWVNLDTLTPPESLSQAVASKSGSYGLEIRSDGSLQCIRDIGWCGELSTNSITTGKWHHVTLLKSSAGYSYYIDGVYSGGDSLWGGNIATNDDSLYVGSRENTIRYLDGRIDDLLIYDYARSPAQIAWDYNRGKPLAHWSFDECYGSTIHDESGTGLHGDLELGSTGVTATGTCASSSASFWYNGKTGKIGKSASLDGADDYIDLGDITNLDGSSQISMSAWLKTDTNSSQSIISKYKDDTNDRSFAFQLFNGTSYPEVIMYISSDGTGGNDAQCRTYKDLVTLNQWHHVLTTVDLPSDEIKIYIDGEEVSCVLEEDNSGLPSSIQNTDAKLLVGARYDSSLSRFFDGQLDEVKIWNYALTNEQVKADYNGAAIRFGN